VWAGAMSSSHLALFIPFGETVFQNVPHHLKLSYALPDVDLVRLSALKCGYRVVINKMLMLRNTKSKKQQKSSEDHCRGDLKTKVIYSLGLF
jgi:hypothetical protein